jgi:transmembrane sensor
VASRAETERAEEAASRFIAARETGPWGDQEAAALEGWLAAATLNRVVYYRLNAAWQEAGRLKALDAGASPARIGWSILPRNPPYWWPRALAASVLLASAIALVVFRESIFQLNSYSTVVGGLESLPIEDGSRVTLNTNSKLHVALSDDERRIDLDRGEAFFEVAQDRTRPFVVRAGRTRVVAVGTQFSVRRDGDEVRVSVTQGMVRIEPAGLLLSAGATARTHAETVSIEKKTVPEVEQALSWRSGILTFRDLQLADAVAELNRYNARKIVIRDPAVAAIRVGGIFGATQPERFARLLESGFPIQVVEEPEQLILVAR